MTTDDEYLKKHPQLRPGGPCALQEGNCKASDCPEHGWIKRDRAKNGIDAGEEALNRATAHLADRLDNTFLGALVAIHERDIANHKSKVGGYADDDWTQIRIAIDYYYIGFCSGRRNLERAQLHRIFDAAEKAYGNSPADPALTPERFAEMCSRSTAGDTSEGNIERHIFMAVSLRGGGYTLACTTCSMLIRSDTHEVSLAVRHHLKLEIVQSSESGFETARLHANFKHPSFEYVYDISPPHAYVATRVSRLKAGWDSNTHAVPGGWEYTNEYIKSYWMKRKP